MSNQRDGSASKGVTARQQRRAKCNDPGADDYERGLVRWLDDESLVWRSDPEDEWRTWSSSRRNLQR